MNHTHRHRQRGAVILTVCLMLLFLLGFMGFALDFGRLFIVKTELQTAMDSCALSAAQELNKQADSITRADSAGVTASNINRVNMQSGNWGGQPQLTAAGGITYRNAAYAVTTNPIDATYAECHHTQPSIQMWLLHVLGAVSGNTTAAPSTRSVMASAVATRASAQTTCPIPVALRPVAGGVAPDYGFTVGQWITMLLGPGEMANGNAGWANLNGTNAASDTVKQMNGFCGTATGDPLGTPGQQANVTDVWNYRFGIYKMPGDPSDGGTPGSGNDFNQHPDFTGYSYTAVNWPSQANAYPDFAAQRQAFSSCAATVSACETATGLRFSGYQKLAPAGPNAVGGHAQYGENRRLVIVPVIGPTNLVIDFACMLMLQPLSAPGAPSTQLEYRGNAGATGSPCTTAGIPGGAAGPLVPVLVR